MTQQFANPDQKQATTRTPTVNGKKRQNFVFRMAFALTGAVRCFSGRHGRRGLGDVETQRGKLILRLRREEHAECHFGLPETFSCSAAIHPRTRSGLTARVGSACKAP